MDSNMKRRLSRQSFRVPLRPLMMHKAQAEARGEGVRARGPLVLGCHVSLTARVCKVEAEPQLNGVGRRAHRRFLV